MNYINIDQIKWNIDTENPRMSSAHETNAYHDVQANLALGIPCTPILLSDRRLIDGAVRLKAYMDAGQTEIPYKNV